MICPSVPGGTTDLVARLVAQKLSEDWRQQVIVDNRGGAGGLIGTEMAARSAPDGYTLVLGTMTTHAVNPAFSKHVQYKGSGPAIIDLAGGQVHMMMTGALALAPHIKAGRLKALAITSPKRNAAMPDLPTVAESGVPGFEVRVWFAVFMPAGAPRPIVNAVNQRIVKMLEIPELLQRLLDQGADPASSTPEELAALVKSDLARWKGVVKATGLANL